MGGVPDAVKRKRFFFHYHKAESRKQGRAMITLHHDKICHLVDGANFRVECPVEGKVNMKKQPNLVMQGWCSEVKITPEGATVK
jgi:hypothetical protein